MDSAACTEAADDGGSRSGNLVANGTNALSGTHDPPHKTRAECTSLRRKHLGGVATVGMAVSQIAPLIQEFTILALSLTGKLRMSLSSLSSRKSSATAAAPFPFFGAGVVACPFVGFAVTPFPGA